MTALLLSLLTNPTVLLILGGIAAAFGWGVKQRRAGAKAERAKQAARDAKANTERLKMNREATEAERNVVSLSDEEAKRKALQWKRR